MSTAPHRAPTPSQGLHVATVAHDGLLWEAYLDFQNDPRRPAAFRASLRFDVAGGDGTVHSARTAVIIIEDSYEEAIAKARAMDDRVLTSLLRSALPDEGE
jgi:hypothetical protein